MALDKVIDSAQLNAGMQATADAIRKKTGGAEPIVWDSTNGFKTAVEGIQAGGGGDEWFNDGNTHIWITLPEGRTSPKVCVCPNGVVTVDWGDGTTPDTLTGTNTNKYVETPAHEYANAGDYVITLTVDGEMGITQNGGGVILCHGYFSGDLNHSYRTSVKRIEIGNGVTHLGDHSFQHVYSLASVKILDSTTRFSQSIFDSCYTLSSFEIPNGVTDITRDMFYHCYSLSSITIPSSVTSIGQSAFAGCYSLASITIPGGVTNINASTFSSCYCMRYIDFTEHSAVPTLKNTNAFRDIPADCEIRVPAALVDDWKAATNWATYADKIVGV